ncbi:MAG: ribosome biogenesis factor YjgA [Desulfobacteraceae bacterium]|jgi:ribosome-associated protein
MNEHYNEQDSEKDEKSRTRVKNEDRELQKLGEKLLTLSNDQLNGIDIPQELIDAVVDARRFGVREARHRQIQYIGTLMRAIDPAPVIRAFELIEAGVSVKRKKVSLAATWLNSLIEGNDSVVEEITAQCPQADRQKLRQLTRNARKAANSPEAGKFAKNLLRYLNEISKT